MESILYSILSFFNSGTSVNMSFDAEAMEEFPVNYWILFLDVRVQNIGIIGFWNSGLRFCFDIVADEFKTVLSHWEVTSHCVVPAFRLITMFEERFTIMATKLYHWDGSLGSKRNLFQLDLTERFAWWMANLYFLLRLSVPHGTLNSSVPWVFFLKCVHRTHLASTKTRSFCIINENACTFDKDAKRLYNKTYAVL